MLLCAHIATILAVQIRDAWWQEKFTELFKAHQIHENDLIKQIVTGSPKKLPPTERVAHFPILRVHLQVMLWRDLESMKVTILIKKHGDGNF